MTTNLAGDFTILAGETYSSNTGATFFIERHPPNTVTFLNQGRIAATGPGATGINSGVSFGLIKNDGVITADASSDVARGIYSGQWCAEVQNNGEIRVSGSTAYGMLTWSPGQVFHNNGKIIVEATGSATGIDFVNGSTFTNKGSIDVTGGSSAIGVMFERLEPIAGAIASFVNDGLIAATATSGKSYGIVVAGYAAGAPAGQILTNYGQITADVAIQDGTVNYSNPQDLIQQVENRGVIHGDVVLGRGADIFKNFAIMVGDVDMGLGDDTVDLSAGGIVGRADLGDGADYAQGSAGADTINGQGGNDQIFGGGGDDVLSGGAGNNTLNGGDGVDTVSYADAAGAMTIHLDGPGPYASGVGVLDTLYYFENVVGSAYGDLIYGDGHDNRLAGMGGNDTFVSVDGPDGADIYDGGEGRDAVSFAVENGVNVDLSLTGPQAVSSGGTATFISIEDIYGSAAADLISGDGGQNRLYGIHGDDVLRGLSGDDTLDGGLGSDILFGGDGADFLYDGGETANRDFLYGGAGNDTYIVSSSFDGPADLVYEGAAVAGAEGGAGDVDVIISRGEFFWDYYGVGEELVIERAAGSQMVGGTVGQKFFGAAGADVILVYGGSNRVDAGGGADAIGLGLYGLDESYDGANTIVMRAGSGMDYVFDFESGVDKIDLSAFNFGITGAQVLAQAINVDNAGTADDYCFFYLTSAGGVDNFVVFMGLLSSQLSAGDFITGTS